MPFWTLFAKPSVGMRWDVCGVLRIPVVFSGMLGNVWVLFVSPPENTWGLLLFWLIMVSVDSLTCHSKIWSDYHPTQGSGRSPAHVPFPQFVDQSHMPQCEYHNLFKISNFQFSFTTPFVFTTLSSERVGSVSEFVLPAEIYISASTDEWEPSLNGPFRGAMKTAKAADHGGKISVISRSRRPERTGPHSTDDGSHPFCPLRNRALKLYNLIYWNWNWHVQDVPPVWEVVKSAKDWYISRWSVGGVATRYKLRSTQKEWSESWWLCRDRY